MTDDLDSERSPAGSFAPQASAGGGEESVRGGFLGFVAHEMRNPLATALWSAELLARLGPEERSGARGEKLTGMCLRALQRLRFLIEDHFLAERLDVSGIPVRSEPLRLREVVDAVVAKAAGGATVDVDTELQVTADRMLLERALDALVAVAARGPTPVSVAARPRDGSAQVVVRGQAPAADALAPPQKGTASDPSGRALAVHMAQRVAHALSGSLAVADDAYVLNLPLGSGAPPPAEPA